MTRANLLTNPSLKTDATGWTLYASSTVSRVTTDAFYGTGCLQVSKGNSADSGATSPATSTLTVGTTYTASAYAKVPSGQEDAGLAAYIDWYTSGGSLISSSPSTAALATLTELDGWVRLAVTAAAPATTAYAKLRVGQPTAGTAGQVFLLDAALFEAAGFAGGYLDELDQNHENAAMDRALKRVPAPHLTGAELNADISLGSLVLNTVDEDGVLWVVTEVDGWWNLPTPNMPTVDRGFADGTYDVRGRFESRAITLKGVILPPDRTKLPAARAKLLEAANLVYRGDWLRLDEGPVKACWVRLIGQPVIDTVNPRGRTEFSLQFRASDPVKYEWAPNDADGKKVIALSTFNKLTGSWSTITNSGNTDVTAVFQVVGPLYGPNASIENTTTGQTMTIVGSLRPTRSYVVNARETDTVGVSKVTLSSSRHNIRVDDEITLASVGTGYNGTWVVTEVADTTVSFYSGLALENPVYSLTGTLVADADVLEIDTYDREVAVNGLVEGSRSQLDTLTDWTYLQPGPNQVGYLDDNQTVSFIKSYSRTSATLVISTIDAHDVYPSDSVYVASPSAIATLSDYPASTATTSTAIHLPDNRGVLTSVSLGPVVYTDTRGQVVTAHEWNLTSKTVTLTTEAPHGMVSGDYLTVDGGYTTITNGVDLAVATSAPKDISTYSFVTSSNVLTLNFASSHGFTTGNEIEVSGMGGDFDGVFAMTGGTGTSSLTVVAVSSALDVTTTSAPSDAVVRRVYRVDTIPTATTLTYKKHNQTTGATYATTNITTAAQAGKVYLLGTGTATVAYRSGWIS